MVMKVLACAISLAKEINIIKIPKEVIKHLLFADDVTVHTKISRILLKTPGK